MPQQKRKASTIASAKIAEDAGSGRKRKSDAKEEQQPTIKESDKSKGGETEQNVSDDKTKKSVDEASDNKRRKKQSPNAQEIHEQQHGNGTNGNGSQGHDLINPQEHDQMLIDEYDKNVEATEQQNGQNEKKDELAQSIGINQQNKVQIETRKELEKKMSPNTLEKGHVCFLYRPKVGVDEVHSIDDVQRMFMVLIPFMVRPSVSEEPIRSYFHQVIDKNQPEADKSIPGKIRVIAISRKKAS